ncbi:aspartate aminotransferase family protein [Phycicoccus endophyticus]|uniref:Aspartate aminotransferase family protein n=1 Tax=Phycicoccus endophyticus TaxID=1690220 RepID=A0A7G9R3P5_9MICO|nr:pyridoxal-dependent decarboxylase [Phycicoccus endophyticus]NHI18040.1 aspartate aminotransferase family protein [Phycicoccus endophyticus]QNN50220.1 aspartate aminotransferase family protein [Phycicoccus endophyticus]GGL26900.1 aromatic-L-amino-acid decarboxylase [Phycicoccus endophyticus]
MTPEEFRTAGHALIDWIADHRARVPDLPVAAQVRPGEVRAALPAHPPTAPEAFDEVLADLEAVVVPGVTQTQHPGFYGWFPSNAGLASVLGDLASGGLGALGITWQSAPALTELEQVLTDWLRELCGLSPHWRGAIQDTASTGCLVALLAARERAGDGCEHRGGLQALQAPLVVYTSPEAHSSVAKGALLAGFGADNLRQVAVDPATYAMDTQDLRHAMAEDAAAGRVPAAVVATVGTTATTAMDPVRAVVEVAREHGAWVHVDAAMAGSAMLLPEMRHLFDGVDSADSLAWNPHKWMGTVLDTSLLYVRDVDHLVSVMSTTPSYLQAATDEQVVQYKDWGIPLGRRFRALKLWFQLRLDGVESVRHRLRRDLANARWLAAQVEAEPGWRVLAPVTLQTVCIRHEPEGLTGDALDAHTLAWVDAVNATGRAFLGASRLEGRWMVRVSIGAEATERGHVEQLWQLLRETASGSSGSERPGQGLGVDHGEAGDRAGEDDVETP